MYHCATVVRQENTTKTNKQKKHTNCSAAQVILTTYVALTSTECPFNRQLLVSCGTYITNFVSHDWTVFQTTVSMSQLRVSAYAGPFNMASDATWWWIYHRHHQLSSTVTEGRRASALHSNLSLSTLSSRNRPVLSNFLRHQSTYALGDPCAELNWWITMRLQQHAPHTTVPYVTCQNIKAVYHVFSISEALIRRYGFRYQQISGHYSLLSLSLSRPVSAISHMNNTPVGLRPAPKLANTYRDVMSVLARDAIAGLLTIVETMCCNITISTSANALILLLRPL